MDHSVRRIPQKPEPPSRIGTLVVFAVIVLLVLFWIRPILQPFLFRFYAAPVVWLLPLLIFLVGVAIAIRKTRGQPGPKVVNGPPNPLMQVVINGRTIEERAAMLGRSASVLLATAVLSFAVFLVMGVLNGPLVAKQLYTHTVYMPLKTLPASDAVRIIPKEVAERVAASGFNSPTEHLSDFHLIRQDGKLAWTALRTPDGAYRAITQQSAGVLKLNASSSSRETKLVDSKLKTAPGMYVTDNLRWRLLKKHYFVELDDPIAITDANNKPLIAVSYIKYSGWFIRRPVFGGVFIVHPDGRIEDVKPSAAMKRKELVTAGRVYPEALARRLQEAYSYKRGLLNKWFSHVDQTQISHTENNPQPYLLDFGKSGLQYVSAAEPFGRAFAVNAIFLTDSITGKTDIWRPARGVELTGNRRVLETVRSLSISGIVFAETTSNAPSDRGGFRVIEPRPVVVRGRLTFMTSIVPDNANNVSKTVFIDAATNRVAAIFNNDSDDQVDQKIAEFIRSGSAPGSDGESGASSDTGQTGATGPTDSKSNSARDTRKQIDEILRRQRELIDELEGLRDQLP